VVETAVAEAVFHRLLFYWESPDTPWPTNPGEYTAFATEFATGRAVDLSHPPLVAERASWTQLMDYTACLDLADVIRAAALQAIRYESVRDRQSRANIALLTCRVFTQHHVVDRQTWHFHFTNSGVRSIREAPSATIQFDRDEFAADPRIAAMKWDRASRRLKQAARPIQPNGRALFLSEISRYRRSLIRNTIAAAHFYQREGSGLSVKFLAGALVLHVMSRAQLRELMLLFVVGSALTLAVFFLALLLVPFETFTPFPFPRSPGFF